MATERGKAAARQAVRAAMSRLGWNQADLARNSGADPKTVSTFMNGQRWPSGATFAKIETALGMTHGMLAE